MTGLFDGIEDRIMNPMVMGGLGLAFGGVGGLNAGMQSGMAYKKNRQEEQRLNLFSDAMKQALNDPKFSALGDGERQMFLANPQMAQGIFGKMYEHQFDPMAKLREQSIRHGMRMDEARLAETRRAHDIQYQQVKYQTPEGRAEIAAKNGLQPGSPQFQQFVMTGTMKQEGPLDALISDLVKGGGTPGAAMSPSPSQPGPRLIPQSAPGQMPQPGLQNVSDVGSDPNLIRTQSAQPQAPDVPMVNTPLGPMPQDKARKVGMAFALGGKGEAGKMMAESPNALGKEGANENDKRALNALEQASRLDSIKAKFKPEYQTYETSVKMGAQGWLDSFEATRGMVSPQDRVKMAEYTQYRQDSMNNLSNYIKEITGAAMGIQEETRIREGMPDPKKDSPTQFEAKLNNSIATAKLALARHSMLRSQGYDDQTIASLARNDKLGTVHSLDQMKSIIDKRLGAAAQEIQAANPGITKQRLIEELRNVQRREFGI